MPCYKWSLIQMIFHKTPLMFAAEYGMCQAVYFILAQSQIAINSKAIFTKSHI